jgi:shikimate kinase
MTHNTISLIGMPGAGKSTVGVLLAKLLGLNFLDSDLLIQVRNKATLQTILERDGHLRLRELEEQVLLEADLDNTLLATGGSAVYSEAAMTRLRELGPVVFIDAPLDVLMQRVDNENDRGIARAPDQDFGDVFAERQPLYQRYADLTVAGNEQSAEMTARLLADQLVGSRE